MVKRRLREIFKKFGRKRRDGRSAAGGWDLKMPLSQGVSPAKRGKLLSFKRVALAREKLLQRRRHKKESFVPPARMKELRKSVRPYILAVLVVALFFGVGGPMRIGYMLKDLSMFKVRSLSVTGCRMLPVKEATRLSGITTYKSSLLALDTAGIEKRLLQEAWVKSVKVKRKWPSEVIIEVTEHRPVALVNMTGTADPELHYINRNGELFLSVGPEEDVDYPVITGLYDVAEDRERLDIFNDILEFLAQASRNNPNLPEQSVSEVHINRRGEMIVYLVDHPFPIFFGKGQTAAKFYRLLHVMESLYREKESETQLSGVAYIRMDYFNDKVLVAQSGSG